MLHRHPVLAVLTGGYLAFVGWLTLTPQPIAPDHLALLQRVLDALHRRDLALWLDVPRVEFLANIALFVPVGVFLLVLLTPRGWWAAALGCVALTVAIEGAQFGIPGRVPDERDLVANTLGGLVGVALGLVLTYPAGRRRRAARANVAPPQGRSFAGH